MVRPGILIAGLVFVVTACSSAVPTTGTTKQQGGNAGTKLRKTGGSGGADSGAESGSGGNAGIAGVAGSAGQLIPFGPLGPDCDAKHPCAVGLTCFAAGGDGFDGFSPPGGLCSVSCEFDSECTAIDMNSRCVELMVGDGLVPKICVPACKLGDDNACGGREDLACWPIGDGDSNDAAGGASGSPGAASTRVCMPHCNHDDQCPDGTVCDGFYNLCSTLAPGGGLALGSECDPAALTNSCAEGFCIELDGGGACSSYCRRGTFPQCGGNGEHSTCGWVFPGDEAAGAADIGMCAGTCGCDAECAEGSHCVTHPDRAGMTKPGICTSGAQPGIANCGT